MLGLCGCVALIRVALLGALISVALVRVLQRCVLFSLDNFVYRMLRMLH